MPSAPATPQMDPACQRSLRQCAQLPPPPAPATAAHLSCAGGEGEWEEIQIGVPAAVEGVAS